MGFKDSKKRRIEAKIETIRQELDVLEASIRVTSNELKTLAAKIIAEEKRCQSLHKEKLTLIQSLDSIHLPPRRRKKVRR